MVLLAASQVRSKEVLEWTGLHLFHFQHSTCSKKVRMVLTLKGLAFESHHINVGEKENVSDFYLGVNPRGLVPVLVHDGAVHIESNDIIAYLDAAFPAVPLSDGGVAGHAAREDALHVAMRTLTFSMRLPTEFGLWSDEKLAEFKAKGASVAGVGQDHAEQYEFWKTFAENLGCTDAQIDAAVTAVCGAFDALERDLGTEGAGPYLEPSDAQTLSDVLWFPTVDRLHACGFSLERAHPRLAAWYAKMLGAHLGDADRILPIHEAQLAIRECANGAIEQRRDRLKL